MLVRTQVTGSSRDVRPPVRPPARMRRPRALGAGLAGAALVAALLLPTAPAQAADVGLVAGVPVGVVSAAVADSGAKVLSEIVIDSRTVDLVIQSPALEGTTKVRLLLPRDWASSPTLSWPTLYVLHGANDPADYQSWTTYTDLSAFTADKNVLLVLPSDGPAGSYTDEYNPTNAPGKPKWETYHTSELPQIIQRGYRSNGSNAAAGLSIGGYGAVIYSARHPGLFKAAASYSGLMDILDPGAFVALTDSRSKAGLSINPWGSRILNYSNWQAHNPIAQVDKLRGTALYISSGRGLPGPLDDPNFPDLLGSRIIEASSGSINTRFALELRRKGVPATVHLYDGGYHYWNYWQREFKASWPLLTAAMGEPTTGLAAPPPAPVPRTWWNALFGW